MELRSGLRHRCLERKGSGGVAAAIEPTVAPQPTTVDKLKCRPKAGTARVGLALYCHDVAKVDPRGTIPKIA